jgi:hypothetical protein
MPIYYSLHPNNLTGGGSYRAVVNFTGSLGREAVIEQMLKQGSTITRADILAVLENHDRAIIELVLAGFKVRTELVIYGAGIKGNFDGPDDTFSPACHQLRPRVSPGPHLRRAMRREGRAVKQESGPTGPHLETYLDVNSGSHNGQVTRGGMAHLSGYRLKFNPADPNQGIFFVAADGSSTRVEVIGKNKPGEVTFLVPATLNPGSYTLMVQAASRRKLRQGNLAANLHVI